MKKEAENQDGVISERIAKTKKVAKRSTKSAETEQKQLEKKDTKKKAIRHTVTRKAAKAAEKEKDGFTEPVKKPSSKKKAKKGETVEFGRGLKIIPLGGLEQIGMNITAFEYDDSIIVVDCGLSFPEDEMLGIDLVIPDISYLRENIEKVKAFVITHGHEDHIGALPYVLKEVNVPIYATKLTMGLIENKLKEHVLPNP